MRIVDLLDQRSIDLNANPKTKTEALNLAITLMTKSGRIADVEAYRKQVFKREEQSTTGIGEGIAIPHGKGNAVKKAGLAAMVIKDGVDFDALDDKPVKILFLIAAPDTKENVHLDVLSKLSVLLMDETFVDKLINAKNVEEFIRIIDSEDSKTEDIDKKYSGNKEYIKKDMILAVTSCPTGIAHTYMAAENLEKAAKRAGCTIKIETRGSSGTKNMLNKDEIDAAKCIIVAADAKVPMERFDGKRVISCQVSDGINKSDELISRALKEEAPLYYAKKDAVTENKDSSIHTVYTELMNGVSYMLPFVVGGGILIALAFLIDGLMVDINLLSDAQKVDFGSITPMAKVLKDIGGAAFGFMLPVLAGYIAMAIGDRPALLLGFVGGYIAANGKSGFIGALVAGFVAGYIIILLRSLCDMLPEALEKIAPVLIYPVLGVLVTGLVIIYVVEPLMGGINTALNSFLAGMGGTSKLLLGFVLAAMMAIDMGGPFNKAAYLFGTAAIAAGNYDIMAAVMIGGMVPPCAIALATLLFKNKFTKEERSSGPTNFIMGLAFITEGAIPYAAADPIRVIPSCIAGAGVAGAISMIFGCTLMAPHGGIFVFPVVGNAVFYVVALLVGTVVSAMLLGILKKRIE